LKRLAQSPARAMQADRRVVGCDSQIVRHLAERLPAEFDSSHQLCVFRLQRSDHRIGTGADRPEELLVGAYRHCLGIDSRG